jgi:hypothetical protein
LYSLVTTASQTAETLLCSLLLTIGKYLKVNVNGYFSAVAPARRQIGAERGCSTADRWQFRAGVTAKNRHAVSTNGLAANRLAENPQQIGNKENHQYGAKPYSCASAGAPAAVAVVSAAYAENQHQDNDE